MSLFVKTIYVNNYDRKVRDGKPLVLNC